MLARPSPKFTFSRDIWITINNQQSAIGQALQEQEYDVVFNDYEFPSSVTQNTLVHAALSLSAAQHDQLTVMLEKMGFDNVSSQYVGKGKHSFTKNNLGLYLYGNVDPETHSPYVLEMANEYSATTCRSINFAYLTLSDDNTAQLVLHEPADEQDQEVQHRGIWLLDGESIFVALESDNFAIEFAREKIHESTVYGPRVGWKLRPVSGAPAIDFCELEHTRVLRE